MCYATRAYANLIKTSVKPPRADATSSGFVLMQSTEHKATYLSCFFAALVCTDLDFYTALVFLIVLTRRNLSLKQCNKIIKRILLGGVGTISYRNIARLSLLLAYDKHVGNAVN